MGKLQGNDAAFVAAALTQAEAALLGGVAASDTGLRRIQPGKADVLIRAMYEQHLSYVLAFDSDTGEGSVSHQLPPPGSRS